MDFDETEGAFEAFSDAQLRKMAFVFTLMNQPCLTRLFTLILPKLVKLKTPINTVIKKLMFKQFFGGETLNDCKDTISSLEKSDVGTVLDYACEGQQTLQESRHIFAEVDRNINFISTSILPKFVVIKASAMLSPDILECLTYQRELTLTQKQQLDSFLSDMKTLCVHASKQDVSILIDAEESWLQGGIDALSLQLIQKYNTKRAVVYMTLQLYRHDRLALLEKLTRQAQVEGWFLGIKLVRGAYMVQERQRALDMHYQSPIYSNKKETDSAFDQAMSFSLDHNDKISLFIGTHNEQSIRLAIDLLIAKNIAPKSLIFSQLFGMGNHLTFNLSRQGYLAYKYLPYGPFLQAIPYLLRRAQENTALEGQTNRELVMLRKELARRRHCSLKLKV